MQVDLYSPERMYGFTKQGPERVFFHLESFVAGTWPSGSEPPPPIVGEEVMVEYTQAQPGAERAPRATQVVRVNEPIELLGVVESFNDLKGWGWIRADGDTESCYLHRSEVEGGRLPLAGQEARFYRGHKNNRARACYVRVGRLRG
jgi:cold shock CspA family protein